MSTDFLRRQLDMLLTERSGLYATWETASANATAQNRALNDTEQAAYNRGKAALARHDANIVAVRANLAEAEEAASRLGSVNRTAGEFGQTGTRGLQVGSSPGTYRNGDVHSPSWVKDMVAAELRHDADAIDRLRRNTREVATEHRALTTVDGAGGEFVPPLWLVDQYVKVARAARVVANQLTPQPLPGGTDSINLPKVATGTSVAEQGTQNVPVSNTDATTSSVTATVATLAGQQVVSVQMIEQSPVNVDEVLLQDLLAELARQVDIFSISNNAANKRGLLNVTGINAVTFTSASPTVTLAYPKIADAIQQIHTGRFMPATKIFMHPRRWAWFLAASDSSNRPLVLPAANTPMNAVAFSNGSVAEDGLVGQMQGLPVYVDANIPINLGAGVNEDRIIVAKADDVFLYEGLPRAEAFRETKADQLSVLLRVYNYLALHSERYPKSISVIAGTGLITPTF